jgi:hypothetical protein
MTQQPDSEPTPASIEQQAFSFATRQLGEHIEKIWKRAGELGMLENKVIYVVPQPGKEDLRISGQPQRVTLPSAEVPLLELVINRYERKVEKAERQHEFFIERNVISAAAIETDPSFGAYDPEDILYHSLKQPPVIWRMAGDDWRVYRSGRQRTMVPLLPAGKERLPEIIAMRNQAMYLGGLLADLTPGCESMKY